MGQKIGTELESSKQHLFSSLRLFNGDFKGSYFSLSNDVFITFLLTGCASQETEAEKSGVNAGEIEEAHQRAQQQLDCLPVESTDKSIESLA